MQTVSCVCRDCAPSCPTGLVPGGSWGTCSPLPKMVHGGRRELWQWLTRAGVRVAGGGGSALAAGGLGNPVRDVLGNPPNAGLRKGSTHYQARAKWPQLKPQQ